MGAGVDDAVAAADAHPDAVGHPLGGEGFRRPSRVTDWTSKPTSTREPSARR